MTVSLFYGFSFLISVLRLKIEERLAIAQRTENRAAVRFKQMSHVKTFDVACGEITVHLASGSRLYHANVMKHCFLHSVNCPVNPFGLFALTCKVPIREQLFRV